jgi:hypothetical protein
LCWLSCWFSRHWRLLFLFLFFYRLDFFIKLLFFIFQMFLHRFFFSWCHLLLSKFILNLVDVNLWLEHLNLLVGIRVLLLLLGLRKHLLWGLLLLLGQQLLLGRCRWRLLMLGLLDHVVQPILLKLRDWDRLDLQNVREWGLLWLIRLR